MAGIKGTSPSLSNYLESIFPRLKRAAILADRDPNFASAQEVADLLGQAEMVLMNYISTPDAEDSQYILDAIASELENPENIALSNADDESLDVIATACVQAAEIFREAAKKTAPPCKDCKGKGKIKDKECKKCKGKGKMPLKKKAEEEPSEDIITPERLDEIAALAEEFDRSGDEFLQKQASVLDAILLSISAPKGVKSAASSAEDQKIEELKKEYAKTKDALDENIKVSDARKDLEKSEYYKQYRPLEAALNTRYCPDHPGVMVHRVGEHEYQCELDKKTYNWETGYRTSKGNVVPGGRVEDQTREDHVEPHALFDTRESRLKS